MRIRVMYPESQRIQEQSANSCLIITIVVGCMNSNMSTINILGLAKILCLKIVMDYPQTKSETQVNMSCVMRKPTFCICALVFARWIVQFLLSQSKMAGL